MIKKIDRVLRIYPKEEEKEYTLYILSENKPGVTANISNVISRRGFNITSFIGAGTMTDDVYKIIIKLYATPTGLKGIIKQIAKLINIIQVKDSMTDEFIEYEMVMVKLAYTPETHGDIFQVVNHYYGEIVDLSDNKLTIAFTGTPAKLDTILALIKHFGILDIVKSGIAVMRKHEENGPTLVLP